MNAAVELLKKSKVFFFATSENNQPHLRPFGAVADIDGKLYVCTNNKKDCFKQMITNPNVEISAMLGAEKWIRIEGIIDYDPSMTAKEEFLKQCPLSRYRPNDGMFEVFFFRKGIVYINNFNGRTESFNLYDN